MKIKIIVITVVMLMSCFLSAQAQIRVCSCLDKEDLLNLLKEAEMSIQEAEYQYQLIKNLVDDAGGKSLLANPERLKELSKNFKNAVKSVTDKDYPKEEMNLDDCSVQRANGSTDCVRQVIKHFSDIMQKRCLDSKTPAGPNSITEMKNLLVDIMKAHYAMRDFILEMLNSLPKNCRPNDWFGYVVYQKVQTEVGVVSKPPTGDSKSGAGAYTGNTSEKNTYIGTVFVEGGKPVSAKVYAAQKIDKNSNGSSRCPTKEGVIERVQASGEKFVAEKETKGNAQFTLDLNPAQGSYNLSVRFFPVDITGQRSVWSKSPHGSVGSLCTDKMSETNDTQMLTVRVNSEGHYFNGEKIKPGSADYLEGSNVGRPPEANESFKLGHESITKTYEIQMRWMLRRLPPK